MNVCPASTTSNPRAPSKAPRSTVTIPSLRPPRIFWKNGSDGLSPIITRLSTGAGRPGKTAGRPSLPRPRPAGPRIMPITAFPDARSTISLPPFGGANITTLPVLHGTSPASIARKTIPPSEWVTKWTGRPAANRPTCSETRSANRAIGKRVDGKGVATVANPAPAILRANGTIARNPRHKPCSNTTHSPPSPLFHGRSHGRGGTNISRYSCQTAGRGCSMRARYAIFFLRERGFP